MTWVLLIAALITAPLAGVLFTISGSFAKSGQDAACGTTFIGACLLLIVALSTTFGLGAAWGQS